MSAPIFPAAPLPEAETQNRPPVIDIDEARVRTTTPPSREVLGVPLFDGTIAAAVDEVIALCASQSVATPRRITATGAHGMVIAARNGDFRETLRSAFLNLPDGVPGVWVARLKGAARIQRCYGPDFMAALLTDSAEKPIAHFLCGGKEGVADSLARVCPAKFGNRNVVGTHCPPFRPVTAAEFEDLGRKIDAAGSDVVWIGISTPKQEIFAEELARYTSARFLISVGAAFDFHIGAVRQAPRWMQKSGLEWFFRLCVEPRRLFRRYAEIVPLFVLLNMREYLSFLSKKVTKRT